MSSCGSILIYGNVTAIKTTPAVHPKSRRPISFSAFCSIQDEGAWGTAFIIVSRELAVDFGSASGSK